MNHIQIDNKESIVIKIVKGILISFLASLISIFLFSIVLTYTNISESIIPIVIVILTFASILIGSIISMRKISKNGMLNGGAVGGIYVMLLYLISSILNIGFELNVYTIIMIASGIVSGIIGGIIGVNT